MNQEKKRRLRSIKVIASELVMVLAVIVMVVILAFLVSGYWINSEGEVDRQGLLQLSSMPTGAMVTIDGVTGSWLERTNMSKNLMSGEHTIELTREGYDSWSKTIKVSAGLLYRIHYPRLFLTQRERETVLDTAGYSGATMSPDHGYLILLGDTTEWSTVNLNSEEIKPVKFSVKELFSGVETGVAKGVTGVENEAKLAVENSDVDMSTNSVTEVEQPVVFNGKIVNVNWDRDSSHALFEVKFGENTEWLLLDVKNPKNSVNISRQFGAQFSEIQILDNSSNNLLVVQNGNLHKVDLGAKSISSVLVPEVMDFDHYNQSEVVFAAKAQNATEGEKPYYVGAFKIGDSEITELERTEQPAKVALSKFYEDKYFTVLLGDKLAVHKKENFETVADFGLSFAPETMEVGHNGEFITMRSKTHLATLDMEAMMISEWDVDGEDFAWIDNDMIYTVKDGQLIVYDYDGLNRRVLAENVSSRFPAGITDDKWLYYFSDGRLVREWLVAR